MIVMHTIEQLMMSVKLLLQNHPPAHDFQHVFRVYKNAELISKEENSVDLDIVLAAALLHDLIVYPKGSIKSTNSANESAEIAKKILLEHKSYPRDKIEKVADIIKTHSYSKKLIPISIEGKILQDADRLDAIGAIGLARAFSVGGSENRCLYNPIDPFCSSERKPDNVRWTLDHVESKLMVLRNSMHTKTAEKIAFQRTEFMKLFVNQLRDEFHHTEDRTEEVTAALQFE
jgi:uncharacterized protein